MHACQTRIPEHTTIDTATYVGWLRALPTSPVACCPCVWHALTGPTCASRNNRRWLSMHTIASIAVANPLRRTYST